MCSGMYSDNTRIHPSSEGTVGTPARCVPGRWDAPVILSCEHASEDFPAGFRLPEEDGWLRGTHWAFDVGIAPFVRSLAGALGAPAVLCGFSRLLVDPNRPPDSHTLFLTEAEGRPVVLNRDVDAEERKRRMALYEGYHAAFDLMVGSTDAATVVSLHSFNPTYGGQRRSLEVGVLFNRDEALAHGVWKAFVDDGFDCALNEPYSGKDGFIYAAERHGLKHGRQVLEMEFRNDLLLDPKRRQRLLRTMGECLAR